MKKTNTIFTKLHADLLRFISKSLPNKTSRYDAFMYLLENQIELINQYKNGSNAPRHYTILGLSNKWKWDRKTVMSFLKSLQDMDVISVKGDVSGITIRTPKYGKIKQSKNELYEACLRCGIFLKGKPNSPKVQFWEGKGVWKKSKLTTLRTQTR